MKPNKIAIRLALAVIALLGLASALVLDSGSRFVAQVSSMNPDSLPNNLPIQIRVGKQQRSALKGQSISRVSTSSLKAQTDEAALHVIFPKTPGASIPARYRICSTRRAERIRSSIYLTLTIRTWTSPRRMRDSPRTACC